MREGWEYKKLGEVCMHKNKILRAAKHYASDEQITYIDISSIDNSQNIILSTTPYVFSDAPSRAQQIVEKGDVLVSLVRPNLKNIAIVNIDNNRLVASSGFCVLRAETNINNRYIFYIVRGNAFTKYLLGRVQGANYPAVREDDVKSYSIPIPPLAEQERIVAELDLLSSIIEKKKAQLKEYNTLAQSIFFDMFGATIEEKGWEVSSFGRIMTLAKSNKCKSHSDLPILSITMHGGIVRQEDRFKKIIASKDVTGYKIIKRGQLVIAFPIDEGLIYTQDIEDEGIMSPAYNVWDVDYTKVSTQFLKFHLHSPIIMKYYKDKLRGTTLRRRMIPKEDLLNLPIPLPPLPLQQEFASKVEAIERQKSLIQQSIVETQTLFDSRMDHWFG